MFKIKMLRTLALAGTHPQWTFHKGRIYSAVRATNQPNHEAEKKIFVEKKNGQSMLLVAGDYTLLN
jgi:hypothetical protein